MPVYPIYVARIDIGEASGTIYSFDDIPTGESDIKGIKCRVSQKRVIQVQSSDGYVVEAVRDPGPMSETGFARMMFDPAQTGQYGNGRIYLRAARVAEMLHDRTGPFCRVG